MNRYITKIKKAERRLKDYSMHFKCFRMLLPTFDDLLHLVYPSLKRQRSQFLEPLPLTLRLAVALRYVATGEGQASFSLHFRIGRSTVCEIFSKVRE